MLPIIIIPDKEITAEEVDKLGFKSRFASCCLHLKSYILYVPFRTPHNQVLVSSLPLCLPLVSLYSQTAKPQEPQH